jgi:hypothetical protein
MKVSANQSVPPLDRFRMWAAPGNGSHATGRLAWLHLSAAFANECACCRQFPA